MHSLANPRFLAYCPLSLHSCSLGGWAIIKWMARDEIQHSRSPSVLSPKYEVFCCDQNGPPARRGEGAYLNRYVTDEQRSRRPIFIATLWAGASWLFFRVARSTRMIQISALLQSGSDRLEKQPTDLRQNTSYFGDRTLGAKILGRLTPGFPASTCR